jgi:Raf kinase inhibitor-like YbhB/YbcL family protein
LGIAPRLDDEEPGMTMTLTSPAFTHRGVIPRRYTGDGENLSPPFAWSGVPGGARSLLLTCDDVDAPNGVFRHWAAFNIPAAWTGLEEGLELELGEVGIGQAVNDFGRPGYCGPCPREEEAHRYEFRLSALDAPLDDVPASASCAEVAQRARRHVLATAELVGIYQTAQLLNTARVAGAKRTMRRCGAQIRAVSSKSSSRRGSQRANSNAEWDLGEAPRASHPRSSAPDGTS